MYLRTIEPGNSQLQYSSKRNPDEIGKIDESYPRNQWANREK